MWAVVYFLARPRRRSASGRRYGAGPSGTRTIARNWKYVDICWLDKIKTDAQGKIRLRAAVKGRVPLV